VITGQVSNRRALVPVTFRLSGQPDLVIEFVVDTGFAGFLTLPLAAVLTMGLPNEHHTPAGLADDSQVQIPVYEAIVVWEGAERAVRLLGMGKLPLLVPR
jgi:clan AA aspartic protease